MVALVALEVHISTGACANAAILRSALTPAPVAVESAVLAAMVQVIQVNKKGGLSWSGRAKSDSPPAKESL